MKRIIFALSLLLAVQYSYALPFPGKSSIPAEIKGYINLHFPNATRVHWLIHEGNYIVSLYQEQMHVELCLNDKGEYQNSIKEIAMYDQIPSKIKTQVDIRKLVYAEKLEGKDGELFYIFEVELARNKIEEMVFDGSGKEIKDHVAEDKTNDKAPDVLKF